MDGLAPSPRRSDRPMVSQGAGHGNDGRRRPPGGFGTLQQTEDGNLSLGRRIGVLVVLAALGGAIVLAAGGIGGNGPVTPLVSPSAHPSARLLQTPGPPVSPPTVAPVLVTPKDVLLTTRSVDLRVNVPEPGTAMTGLEVRIYRNSRELKSQRVNDVGRVKIRDVPLRRGVNKLTATIANSGGDGPRSEIVTITVDDQAPRVTVKTPRSERTLNQPRVTVQGKTELGLPVTGRNITTGSRVTVDSSATGGYQLELGLALGRNTIIVQSRDTAGNRGKTTIVVIRGDGRASADLWMSRKKFPLESLPRTVDARVTVRDADGRPVNDATVTFTLSPPGQPTSVYPTTSGKDGVARWSDIRLTSARATAGTGMMTVLVVAPDSSRATDTLRFEFK